MHPRLLEHHSKAQLVTGTNVKKPEDSSRDNHKKRKHKKRHVSVPTRTHIIQHSRILFTLHVQYIDTCQHVPIHCIQLLARISGPVSTSAVMSHQVPSSAISMAQAASSSPQTASSSQLGFCGGAFGHDTVKRVQVCYN